MTRIETIPHARATGRLKALYERVKGPDDAVDNILGAHSLRPHTLEGRLALYKHVLRPSVTTDGDILGLSPSGGDPEDWGHR